MPRLHHSIQGQIATIVLSDPPRNSLTQDLVIEFADALDEIAMSDARALLLRAEGADFSYGGPDTTWAGMSQSEISGSLEKALFVFNRFERLAIPTIVAVQGRCSGGGFELAMRGDVVIAAESARFFHHEARLGLATILGGVYRLAERAGRQRAMKWVLTSEDISPQELERVGLVTRVVEDGKLLDEAKAFAKTIADGPTKSHVAHKKLLLAWESGGIDAADEAVLQISLDIWASEDGRNALKTKADLNKAGKSYTLIPFQGR